MKRSCNALPARTHAARDARRLPWRARPSGHTILSSPPPSPATSIGLHLQSDIAAALARAQSGTAAIHAAADALQGIVEQVRLLGTVAGAIIADTRRRNTGGHDAVTDSMKQIELSFDATAPLLLEADDTVNALRCLATSATLVIGTLAIRAGAPAICSISEQP
jgi:hypothetical protein